MLEGHIWTIKVTACMGASPLFKFQCFAERLLHCRWMCTPAKIDALVRSHQHCPKSLSNRMKRLTAIPCTASNLVAKVLVLATAGGVRDLTRAGVCWSRLNQHRIFARLQPQPWAAYSQHPAAKSGKAPQRHDQICAHGLCPRTGPSKRNQSMTEFVTMQW